MGKNVTLGFDATGSDKKTGRARDGKSRPSKKTMIETVKQKIISGIRFSSDEPLHVTEAWVRQSEKGPKQKEEAIGSIISDFL